MIELESVLLVLVISGATPKSGRGLCNGAQLATGPTPGNGWLYSRGLTRCVPFWPTYAVVSEKLRANWNSVLKLYCWISAGRRSGFQARTCPESVDSGSVSVNPVRMSPGVRASKVTADSKKKGGLRGRRRLAPVPSI